MKKATAGILAAAMLLSATPAAMAGSQSSAPAARSETAQHAAAQKSAAQKTDVKKSGQKKTVKKAERKRGKKQRQEAAREAAQAPAEKKPAVQQAPAAKPFLVKQGARGEDVKIVQTLLKEMGYPVGEIDGICGPQTSQAIESFQIIHGLLPSGVVDRETLAYMKRAEPAVNRSMRSIVMAASAYSAYETSGYTARGSYLRRGLVAVDPNVIPLGTRLYIPGYGHALADDTGGAIRGNRIDLAFDSYEEAIQFGRREVTVYIVE